MSICDCHGMLIVGDIENANERIDDLKDEVHDLEQDLRASGRECVRLEAELERMIDDEELTEADHKRQVKVLKDAQDEKHEIILHLKAMVAGLESRLEGLQHNYIRALSIAETVRENGTADYFRTKSGKDLLDWAVAELKREAYIIMKG